MMAKMPAVPKRPKPYRTTKAMKRFGILNPYGDFWTAETFTSEAEARRYIISWWKNAGGVEVDRFKIVPARVTVSAA